MATTTGGLRWGRIVVGGLLAFVLSFLAVFLVITGYAFKLGFEARGAPDQEQISQFAESVGPLLGPITSTLFIFVLGYWAARKAVARHALHGTLVGLLAGGVSFLLFSLPPTAWDFLFFGLALVAGWAGGRLAGRG